MIRSVLILSCGGRDWHGHMLPFLMSLGSVGKSVAAESLNGFSLTSEHWWTFWRKWWSSALSAFGGRWIPRFGEQSLWSWCYSVVMCSSAGWESTFAYWIFYWKVNPLISFSDGTYLIMHICKYFLCSVNWYLKLDWSRFSDEGSKC